MFSLVAFSENVCLNAITLPDTLIIAMAENWYKSGVFFKRKGPLNIDLM